MFQSLTEVAGHCSLVCGFFVLGGGLGSGVRALRASRVFCIRASGLLWGVRALERALGLAQAQQSMVCFAKEAEELGV